MRLPIALLLALAVFARAEDRLQRAMEKDPRIEQGLKVSFAFTLMHPDPGDDGSSFFASPKVVEEPSSRKYVLRALVPDDAWAQMSDSDKKAYTIYVKWLASEAPQRPEDYQPYSIRPGTPEWARAVELTRKMSPESWEIVICKQVTTGKWAPSRIALHGNGV